MLNGDNLHHIVKIGGLNVFGKMRQTSKSINRICNTFGKQLLLDFLEEMSGKYDFTELESKNNSECDHRTQIGGCTPCSDNSCDLSKSLKCTKKIDQNLSLAEIVNIVKFKLRTLHLRALDQLQKQVLEATAVLDDSRYRIDRFLSFMHQNCSK
jgi:hypothetical protein